MRPGESFLGQPIRSLQTMLRVLAEDDERYLPIIPDGIYGPETMASVTRFQQIHGLAVTGITDQDTWEAVEAAYEPALIRADSPWPLNILMDPGQVIRRGEQHSHVFLVQGMLAALAQHYESILPPQLTGVLDAATADALSSFQQLSNLPATGELDKNTWKHLALQYPLASTIPNRQPQRRDISPGKRL